MYTDMAGGAAVLGALRLVAELRAADPGDRPAAGGRELGVGLGDAPERRDPPLRRAHQRGQQHRRRGPAGAGRRDGLRGGPAQADRADRPGHADRRDEGGAGRRGPAACSPRPTSWPRGCSRPATRPASRCGGCRWPRTTVPTLQSDIADANNSPGNPGGITAALFLRPFAGGVPWAHLDIAGPARSSDDAGRAQPRRDRLRRPPARRVAHCRRRA